MCTEKGMENKSLFLGLFFLLVGATFLFLENTFYQYIDKDGFLHESLFQPLGALSLFLGVLLILYFAAKNLLRLTKIHSEK